MTNGDFSIHLRVLQLPERVLYFERFLYGKKKSVRSPYSDNDFANVDNIAKIFFVSALSGTAIRTKQSKAAQLNAVPDSAEPSSDT